MDKMREEFKAWYEAATGLPVEFNDVGIPVSIGSALSGNIIICMWLAWRDSRAALCVELPRQWFDDGLDCDLMEAHQVGKALDEAGVQYK